MRAIDVLQSLPEVEGERIGSIGHSLGGYNTVFLGALEPRVKAMVTSAGYNALADYAASPYGGGNLAKWSLDKHLRRVRTVYDNDPAKVPCDFPEMIAAIAPRPLLTIAPKQDEIFVLPGVVKCLDAARPVYELLSARDHLQSRFPEGGHDFLQADREAAYAFLDKHLRAK
jgi:dienelactone hydrolase